MKPLISAAKKFFLYYGIAYVSIMGAFIIYAYLNVIVAASGIPHEVFVALMCAFFGVLPHFYFFLKYKRIGNHNIPILKFYMYYMIIFSVWLLPFAISFANNSNIPFMLSIVYLPQVNFYVTCIVFVENPFVVYLISIIFNAALLLLTVCINDRNRIFDKIKRTSPIKGIKN